MDKSEWLMLQVCSHLGTYLQDSPVNKQELSSDIYLFSWRLSPIHGGISLDTCLQLLRL